MGGDDHQQESGRVLPAVELQWWPPPYSYTRYDYFYEFSWTREQWETYKNLWGSSEIAVPFNDSEAIYIDATDCEMKRKGNHYRWDLSTKTGRPNEEPGE